MYLFMSECDHLSRQLKTPSQDLQAPLLLVHGGLREQLILLSDSAFYMFKTVVIFPIDIL